MKILYFLAFIVLCQGLPLDTPPTNVDVVIYQNDKELYFTVTWDKVENQDDTDPILGYKVKVFERIEIVNPTNEDDSKQSNTIFEERPKGPTVKVAEIEVPADKTEVKYDKMKLNVLYEVAVQAYTAKKVGPLSPKYKFSWV